MSYLSNPATFNISITEFYKNYECIDESGDMWQHKSNGKTVQIKFESDDYMVVYYT